MLGEEDKDRLTGGVNRRIYSRSVSWSDNRSPTKPIVPRPPFNSKARACLPPLQPLAVTRPSAEEWPRAGSDDLGVWPNPSTPRVRIGAGNPIGSSNSDKPPREFEFKKDKLAFFDKECSRIAEHVYLGSDAVAKNRDILRQNGITHVLNCVGFVCPEYFKNDLVYKTLWLQDSPSEDITSILYDVFDYFEDVREQGGRVLVHCCQGVSRSTSLVIAYVMWRDGQSFEDAFQYVKGARGVTNPNMGFACQLLQCQKRVHAVPASPNSMLRVYRMAPHSPYAPLHLVPKMLDQPCVDGLDSRGAFIVHVPSAIYVWIGKICRSVMSNTAGTAALQVIRYEKAQGPVLTIREGEEPSEFWVALGIDDIAADNFHRGVGQRKVDEYDLDFEMFSKALAGGVVPPFSSSGNGSETCLPARENGWGRLRRKFASGIMKQFITSSKLIFDDATQSDGPDMAMDTDRDVGFSISPTEPSCPSSPPCNSPDSFSRFLVKNSNFGSSSPSLSPSTSDYSNSFTFSPSSSNWSDLSYLSAQPSPSGLESSHPYPSKEPESVCFIYKETSTSPEESRSSNHAMGNTSSPSIAERRGSNPPPRMRLPSVDESSQVPMKVPKSWSFSLPKVEDYVMRDIEGFHEMNREEIMLDAEEFEIEMKDEDDYDTSRISSSDLVNKGDVMNGLVLYRWPAMDKVEMHCFDILDSTSVYVMFVPDANLGMDGSGILYVWVGRDVACEKGQSQLMSGDGTCNDDSYIQWEKIGRDVLVQQGLATNSLVQIVREGEEPEELLKHLQCFSFQKAHEGDN